MSVRANDSFRAGRGRGSARDRTARAAGSARLIAGADGVASGPTTRESFLRYMADAGGEAETGDRRLRYRQDIPRLAFLHDSHRRHRPRPSAFRQHGGKLIMYFGWADPQLNPRVAVEYYEHVRAQMGDSTRGFRRLFMVPGMFHCGGGLGTSTSMPPRRWCSGWNRASAETIAASRVVERESDRVRVRCVPTLKWRATKAAAASTTLPTSVVRYADFWPALACAPRGLLGAPLLSFAPYGDGCASTAATAP